MRCPASSTNLVAAAIRPCPTSRMMRLRSSSRFRSMKITRMIASASSPKYSMSGLRNDEMRESQAGLGGSTTTAVGFDGTFFGSAAPDSSPPDSSPPDSCSDGLPSISWLISAIIVRSWPEPAVSFLSDLTLSLTVSVCWGNSRSSLEIWAVTTQPPIPRARAAAQTVTITAGVRGIPNWRSRETSGLSRKVRKMASATGMKIDWAQYRTPTTTTLMTVPDNTTTARCHWAPPAG